MSPGVLDFVYGEQLHACGQKRCHSRSAGRVEMPGESSDQVQAHIHSPAQLEQAAEGDFHLGDFQDPFGVQENPGPRMKGATAAYA